MSGPIVLVLRVLLAASLYAFLGWALWLMWQELNRTSNRLARRRVPAIRLEVRTKKGNQTPRAFTQPEIIVGRDPLADVTIADQAVSLRHALLSFHHGQWWLDDLGSTNGTRLNRVQLTGSTVLTNGDEIKCGQARLVVRLTPDPQPSNSQETAAHDG